MSFNFNNLCACGCGIAVKGRFKRGHNSRLPEQKEFKRLGIQRAFVEGRLVRGPGMSWNTGLTKQTDERVLKSAKTLSRTNSSPEMSALLSKRMSQFRKNGTVVSPSGSQNGMWKGGTTTITQGLRGSKRYYHEWKLPILNRDCFSCTNCGSKQNVVVHHDKERCSHVVSHVLNQLYPDVKRSTLSFDQRKLVVNAVVDYHIQNNVSGVTLCRSCHNEYHRVYGK